MLYADAVKCVILFSVNKNKGFKKIAPVWRLIIKSE